MFKERRPSPTVYGIETEYSCMVTLPGNVVREIVGDCHSVDTKLQLYQQPDSKGTADLHWDDLEDGLLAIGLLSNHSGMLSNGGRFYMDPSGPEYATPETRTAEEAVFRSFDGDRILWGVFRYLQKQGTIENFQVNRRNVDHNRSSRGVHLNTMTSLPADPAPKVKQWLATLNVAKGAIFGSGGLLTDEKGETHYHHSPRLSVTDAVSREYADYRTRPLVRIPFKNDGEQFRRIETVTSDALNLAWPLRASLVTTNALVGLLEMRYGHRLPRLRHPVRAAQIVGRYGNLNQVSVTGPDGSHRGVKPLDIIRDICETALEVDQTEDSLDTEARQVLPEVIEVADRISDDMYSAADRVESVARFITMHKKMKKDSLRLDSETMCRFDYAWDWVEGGIAEHIRQKGLAGWQGFSGPPSLATEKKRLVTPPHDTRAKVRADFFENDMYDLIKDWSNIAGRYIGPFNTSVTASR